MRKPRTRRGRGGWGDPGRARGARRLPLTAAAILLAAFTALAASGAAPRALAGQATPPPDRRPDPRPATQPATQPVPTDSAGRFVVPRLTGPITLDGSVDEPAWEAIPPLPVTMHLPTFGAEPTERTEIRVAYDDRYIYLSCRNYDSDPAGIQAPTLRRDGSSLTNDWCVLQLDTFNDKETGLAFGTTPAGIRTDVVWPNDGESSGNFSWNTFWDAAVSRDDHGWYAEIRVPLSSLRFQERDGQVVMGVSAWRGIARKNEYVTFPAIDNRWGGFAVIKASQYRESVFHGIRPTRPVYVTPYLVAAGERIWEQPGQGLPYEPVRERQLEVGGDLKVPLASNLTLDLTVNTDFAQAEADDQQVNLSRFSLFFPEKRLFFQERGETFAFGIGGNERLFHSRRIGILDGSPVPILGGARLVGRVGEWDVGLLDMQTRSTALGPGENLGVVRLRRRVLNENSYLGGIVTTRIAGGDGGPAIGASDRNILYGLDAIVRVFGQDYLTVNWAQSFDRETGPADADGDLASGVGGGASPLDRAFARLFWERRGVDGFAYSLELARAGDVFEPGLGFLVRRDYSKAAASTRYGWRAGPGSPVLRHGFTLKGNAFTRNEDRSLETGELTASWDLALKSGHSVTAALTETRDHLRDGFSLSGDADVPAGDHRYLVAGLAYEAPGGRLVRTNANLMAGQFYDGSLVSLNLTPTWFASRHLELGGAYQVNRVAFPDRDQSFTSHVARLRTQVMLNPRVLATAFVQYNSAADRLSGNLRFRYNPSEGHDLYVVWNEQILTDLPGHGLVPPRSESRVLIVKYARTLTLARRPADQPPASTGSAPAQEPAARNSSRDARPG
jgi:hypothetical protein